MFQKLKMKAFALLTRHQGIITLSSGRVIYIHAQNIETTRQASGPLIGLKADLCRDFPLYLRLDDVASVQTRRVLR